MPAAFSHRRAAAPLSLTVPGAFVVGCNYWASHAGTRTWSDWRPAVVDHDLRKLAKAGLQVLRVFPLWPDFQPIHTPRGGHGRPVEVRFGEEPMPDDPTGQAGVAAVMLERFGAFLDLADRHGLRCIVGLVTGWMSGRLFVPPALESLNPLTDPQSIRWQVRLVRQLVSAFRGHPAVLAWDLGNECNCMGPANRDQAYAWTATIANTIRAADPTRPIVSGMHSLTPDGAWTMQDQGELTDVLTTHPYPMFTPHCGKDPLNTFRSILHSTVESRYYADLGGQPCLCEEIGSLGPQFGSEAVAAEYMRACLWSLWAHDCHGALWWCGFEQTHLGHAPYDWNWCERELGLFRANGSPKPVLREFTAFRAALAALPFRRLPPRRRDAVCLLSQDQDTWAVAYSAFGLAKQAGFDLEFQHAEQPLRPASLYLLPATRGGNIISRRRWLKLLERVAAGATLYTSMDEAVMHEFSRWAGLRIVTREQRAGAASASVPGAAADVTIPVRGGFKLRLEPAGATVLVHEADGNPLFAEHRLGRGRVFFLAMPLETELAHQPGVFAADAPPYRWFYQQVAAKAMAGRAVRKENPLVTLTEHPVRAGERVVIAINLSPEPLTDELRLASGSRLGKVWRGKVSPAADGLGLALPACDAAILQVVRS